MEKEASLRSRMLIGDEAYKILENSHITVCGLGGVGSWAAEGLVRSGIGCLSLIDFDTVAYSNINRQLPAYFSTLGQHKASVLAKRFKDINPKCKINIIEERLTQENLGGLIPKSDYIIDAIDDIPAKTQLIAYAINNGLPILSSMGTGNKLAPESLKIGDISQTSVCPLAREIRKRLRKLGIEKGVKVVYSDEKPHKEDKESGRTPASMVFVPASAGLLLASVVIRELINKV